MPEPPASHEDSASGPVPEDSRVNILIVDDEQKNLTVLETILEDASYRLIRSASAEEALLSLIGNDFALLILDIHMPGMSGFELAQMIRQRKKNAHVPIIFLTAYYNEDEHVLEGYGTGAVDYLHKPVNPVVLRSKVSVFVELYRKSRDLGIANRTLLAEIAQRRRMEEQLQTLNESLELRIAERTQELRASEQQFRQLADSMPQMVWTASPDGRFDYYNARWRQFSGFGPEAYGTLAAWTPLLHPDDSERCQDAWRRAVAEGGEFRAEFRLLDRRTQHFFWYLGRALPVRNTEGRIVKWFGTCTDIEDQKRLEESLRRANQALEQFAYAASHDLQEPLRNVAIFAELLRQRYSASLNPEATGFLDTIVAGSRRMGSLMAALLEYMQSTHLGAEPVRRIDVEGTYARVLQNLERVVQESQAEITRGTLPSLLMEEVHIEQLLQNLIGNALKYRRDGVPPRVNVTAWRDGANWHFAVQDNGIGIEPEYHAKIFGVFKRLHARGEKYSGTGMGLAICQKIVESYQGRIWVESKPGQGATFHFTIPAAGELRRTASEP